MAANVGGDGGSWWWSAIAAGAGLVGAPVLLQKLIEHFFGKHKIDADADQSEANAEEARARTVSGLYDTMQRMLAENHLLRESQERMEGENHELRLTLQRMEGEMHEMRSNFKILCSALLILDSNCDGCAKNPMQGKIRSMIDGCLEKARQTLEGQKDDETV